MTEARLWILFTTIVSVASLVVADEAGARCPSGLPSTSLMKLYNDTCYQFVQEEKYWDQAKDYCLRYNGRLIKIADRKLNEFIRKTLSELWWRNKGIWIGLNDRQHEQTWEWTSYRGERDERAGVWANWASNHPGTLLHTGKDCVKMVRDLGEWKWEEAFCSTAGYTYRFICQYRAKALHTTLAATTVAEATTEMLTTESLKFLTTEEEIHQLPIQAEVRSEPGTAEQNGVGLWLIIAGCVAACLFIFVSVCLVVRYRNAKKRESLNFSALDRKYVAGTAHVSRTLNPAYAGRPLPCYPEVTETCSPDPYYSLAREEPQRAEFNVYLNAASMPGTYLTMNQSTSSIDKLPPPPANPVGRVIYATPARQSDHASCLSGEYLCPSEVGRKTESGYGAMKTEYDAIETGYDVMGDYDVKKGDEKLLESTYDKPKALNEYSEIPEAFYNNVYESVEK